MTDEERRQRTLEKYQRYNRSEKGAARYRRYEEAHPERATQWSELMRIKARRGNP